MNIAIIGTGNVGGALAKSLASVGHRILLGAKEPEAEEAQALTRFHNSISAHSVRSAALQAEVLIIAVTPSAIVEIAPQLGDLADKVVIDSMNAFNSRPVPYAGTIEALSALTNCPHIVKCFNTTGYENMINPRYGELGADMFVAGNSEQGKAVAKQLALDIGFDACYDFGGLENAPLLEQLAKVWINLAIVQKHGRNIAFKLLRR